MARYSLFVLKVLFKPDQPTNQRAIYIDYRSVQFRLSMQFHVIMLLYSKLVTFIFTYTNEISS